MRITFIIVLGFGWLASFAQVDSLMIVPGWRANSFLELDHGFGVVSLGADSLQDHSILWTTYDSELKNLNIDTLDSDTFIGSSVLSSFGITQDNQKVLIGGVVYNNKSNPVPALYTIDDSTLLNYRHLGSAGYLNNVIIRGDSVHLMGSYKNASDDFRLFKYEDHDRSLRYYTCKPVQGQNGCGIELKNVIKHESGFILACENFVKTYPAVRTGILISIDSSGNEVWRTELASDTFTINNLIVSPLADGNLLAVWQDYYVKPYMSNRSNPFVVFNDSVTIWSALISSNGDILSKHHYKSELTEYFTSNYHISNHSHYAITSDSSIIIVGSTIDYEPNENNYFYLIKFNLNGEFQWYKRHDVTLGQPYNTGIEKFTPEAITVLANGGISISGEYVSKRFDSTLIAEQKAMVIFLDEHGCAFKNCSINKVSQLPKNYNFIIHPNPANQIVRITSSSEIQKVDISNISGQHLFSIDANSASDLEFNVLGLTSGLYILKVHFNDGAILSKKLIIGRG